MNRMEPGVGDLVVEAPGTGEMVDPTGKGLGVVTLPVPLITP